jgi:hypothetical protein
MVRYTSEQRTFLYDTYMKYGSTGKCRRKFRPKFCDGVPTRYKFHNLATKLGIAGVLIDKKTKHKHRVLTEEKLDDIGLGLKHTPRKPLKH